MSRNSKTKKLLNNIFYFSLATIVPKLISFFLVPIYTTYLTTVEYGKIDLTSTIALLLMPILTLQIQDAILRFSLDKNYNKSEIFTIGLKIVLSGIIFLTVVTFIAYYFRIINFEWEYYLYFILTFSIGSLTNIVVYFLKAIDKVKVISTGSIINTIITITLNILLLVVFNMGWRGYLIANTFGNLIALIYFYLKANLQRYIYRGKIDRKIIDLILIFSFPMILSALSWWVNNSLDKYILNYFYGASATGLLAIAYKIPTIASYISSILSKSFSISIIEHFDDKDEDGFIGSTYSLYSLFLVILTSFIVMVNYFVSSFLFSKEFFNAWILVPPLVISTMYVNLSLYLENILIALNNTKLISFTALIGAIFNTITNFIFIPRFGAYAATVTTAFSFALIWLSRFIYIKSRVKLKNKTKKEFISYLILIIQIALAYFGNRYLLIQILIFAILVIINFEQILTLVKRTLSMIKRI